MRRIFQNSGLIMSLLLLGACSTTHVLPQGEAEAYAAEVELNVENMLVGLSNGDYDAHSRDFDDAMREAIDPTTFPQVYDQIIGTLGAYQSHTLVRVEQQGDFTAVIYSAVFENESDVTVRIVFLTADEAHRISGLWFDSPLLREEQ